MRIPRSNALKLPFLALVSVLLLSCGGAGLEIREERTIALYHGPEGERPVLVSVQGLEDHEDAYAEAATNDLTTGEQERALRSVLLGGRCHASGAVIPPLDLDRSQEIWKSLLVRTFQERMERPDPCLSFEAQLDQAVWDLATEHPVLAPFEDRAWIEMHKNREKLRQEAATKPPYDPGEAAINQQ